MRTQKTAAASVLALGIQCFLIAIFAQYVLPAQLLLAQDSPEATNDSFHTSDKRSFADVKIEEVDWVFDPHQHLLHPMQVKFYDERMYVWDQGDTRLKVFAMNGRHIGTIERGSGKAPGELVSVMDYFVRAERVWMLDGVERKVSVFRTNGEFIRRISLRTDGHPNRLASLGDHILVRQFAPKGEQILEVDTTGQVLRRFWSIDEFIDKYDEKNLLAYSGDLMTTDSSVVFGASKASYLHFFTDEGNLMRTIETIDEQPYEGPPRKRGNGGIRYNPPTPPIHYRAFTIEGDTIKMNAADYDNRRAIIDYYDMEGHYLESVLLPEPVTVAYPHRGRVITIQNAQLKKFRIVRLHE